MLGFRRRKKRAQATNARELRFFAENTHRVGGRRLPKCGNRLRRVLGARSYRFELPLGSQKQAVIIGIFTASLGKQAQQTTHLQGLSFLTGDIQNNFASV